MIPNRSSFLNFDLGETATLLRDSVKSFAQKEIAPIAQEIDHNNEFPRHLW
ncbi:MAG: acyl-CoA dehydrogenase family protein, partial [Alphaproteobacteria bacterium]|nr:acyl-CoA dehydrogenase family protein [Alphaproteobacteria bacterium]